MKNYQKNNNNNKTVVISVATRQFFLSLRLVANLNIT